MKPLCSKSFKSILLASLVLSLMLSGSALSAHESSSLDDATTSYKREDYRRALKDCTTFLEHHLGDPEALRF